jgi:alpha-L-rhamnosidase
MSSPEISLALDLVPAENRAELQKKLVNDVLNTRAGHEEVGIVGTRWILPVLSKASEEGVPGAIDAAYAIATQTTYPSYGYWMGMGWTALGESWERTSRTRSHHMFGPIGQWFYENLAGIQPVKPGYEEILFVPTIPTNLDHASASYESGRGMIVSSWKKNAGKVDFEFTVPPRAFL